MATNALSNTFMVSCYSLHRCVSMYAIKDNFNYACRNPYIQFWFLHTCRIDLKLYKSFHIITLSLITLTYIIWSLIASHYTDVINKISIEYNSDGVLLALRQKSDSIYLKWKASVNFEPSTFLKSNEPPCTGGFISYMTCQLALGGGLSSARKVNRWIC